jgi:hypothetical protein
MVPRKERPELGEKKQKKDSKDDMWGRGKGI